MDARIVETHSALLVFAGDHVYKSRKAVDLGFLDHRSVESRRAVSEAEVALNSRLAPDVYEGVLEVRDTAGAPVDYVVQMRRLDPARRLSALVADRDTGTAGPVDLPATIDQIAALVADLHAASPRTAEIDAAGEQHTVSALWSESLTHLAALPVGQDATELLDDVRELSRRYLAGRSPLLAERVAAGRIVDGHGDLLADDIFCLDDGPRIIDCLEFCDRFRFGDAILDLAFLLMELLRLGARDLAARLLEAYRERSGDDAPVSLVWHYMAYRALVRSKVTAIRAEQSAGPAALAAARESLELLAWSADALLAGRVRLVLVGGVSGSGKSVASRNLAPLLEATVLRTDELRQELPRPRRTALATEDAAVADTPTPADYSPAGRGAVYTEMLDRAATLLRHGRSVILDATWLDPRLRAQAETLASDTYAELVEIECVAPEAVLARRITERGRRQADPSEATVQVMRDQLAGRADWPDAAVLDTVAVDVRDRAAVAAWALHEGGFGPPARLDAGS